jgi:hypothetical protein
MLRIESETKYIENVSIFPFRHESTSGVSLKIYIYFFVEIIKLLPLFYVARSRQEKNRKKLTFFHWLYNVMSIPSA